MPRRVLSPAALGLGTIAQACPFQCSVSVLTAPLEVDEEPTA
jgi:hypothetical protein